MSTNDNNDERIFKVIDGQCRMGVCGSAAACRDHRNNTYTCLCPHDSLPPTKDGRCPTRITVPLDPRKIENIMPPQIEHDNLKVLMVGDNSTKVSNSTSSSESSAMDAAIWQIPVLFTFVSIIILVSVAVFRLRRRSISKRYENACFTPGPMMLKDNLLLPERYAPNPHYSFCDVFSYLKPESITFKKEIGRGCFGTVYKGELLLDPNKKPETVAIKVLKESASRELEEDFLREVEITSAFQHKNILTLIGVSVREPDFSPMMVFEYMRHGDLVEVLRYQNKVHDITEDQKDVLVLTRKDLLSIALQISNGMDYLASQRFVHRDLACRNCLVTDGPTVKIADFGMSRDVYTCDYYKIGGTRLLPVRWMSPESVLYGRFTLESDIWSYGVVLWEIYTLAKQPYYGHSNDEVVKLILQGIMLIPPDDCPPFICDLMKNCWKTEPKDRIKFSEIYKTLKNHYPNFDQDNVDKPVGSGRHRKADVMKSLPRPPKEVVIPLPSSTQDLLDPEGYLQPKIMNPVQYLELQISNN